jgi:hypothetical protein
MFRSMTRVLFALTLLTLVACGGSSSSSTSAGASNTAKTSNLTVAGITNNQEVTNNVITIGITNSPATVYALIRYELDPPTTFPTSAAKTIASGNASFTLTQLSSGSHDLYIQGVYADGTSDSPLRYSFNVSGSANIAVGRFRGDYMFYSEDATKSTMALKVVDLCELTRNNDVIAGTMTMVNGSKMKVSDKMGASIVNGNATASSIISMIMEPASAGADSFSGTGLASYHLIHFQDLATNFNNSPTFVYRGDVRLYRDSNYLLRANAILTATNQTNRPKLTAYLTIFSLDNKKYEGYIRLVNTARNKIVTYDLKGGTATGLTMENDGLDFNLTAPTPAGTPFFEDGRDFGAQFPIGSGTVVVGNGSNTGNLVIKQLRLSINNFGSYFAIGDINTITQLTPN